MILSADIILKKIFHKKKITQSEVWKNRAKAFLVGAGIILFWRGVWNLADYYIFPSNPNLSALIWLIVWLSILMLSHNFVNQFLDEAVEEAGELE